MTPDVVTRLNSQSSACRGRSRAGFLGPARQRRPMRRVEGQGLVRPPEAGAEPTPNQGSRALFE